MKHIFKIKNKAFNNNGLHGADAPLSDGIENGQSTVFCHSEPARRGIHGRKSYTPAQSNESGRSMVEMLGVLAIIGVLSIGGIAGYRMAMTQHKVNEMNQQLTMDALEMSNWFVHNEEENSIFYNDTQWFLDSGPVDTFGGYWQPDTMGVIMHFESKDFCKAALRNVPVYLKAVGITSTMHAYATPLSEDQIGTVCSEVGSSSNSTLYLMDLHLEE